jgi:multidrug efflux pump subunit AcrA (membrane-fusion protein)
VHGSQTASQIAVTPTRRRRRLIRWIGALALLALGGTAVAFVLSRSDSEVAGNETPGAARSEEPVTVTRGSITPIVTLDATVTAQPRYMVLSPALGRVERGNADPGQVVPAGTPLFKVDNEQVTAPADCLINAWLTSGLESPAGLPVVDCTYPGFGLAAQFPPDDAYVVLTGSLTGTGQINNGPAPFDCPILSGPTGSGPDAKTSSLDVTVLCAVPTDVRGIPGVGALVAVKSTLVSDVLVLPRSAVRGSVDTGVVNLLTGRHVEERKVTLGATDGNRVEISAGLEEGDRVSATPPSLDAGP